MAITFEKAKRMAFKIDKTVNICYEYQMAYHFINTENDSDGNNGVVILKDTGKTIPFITFLLRYHPERRVKFTHKL